MAYGNSSLLSDRGRAWLGSVEGVPPQQVPARAEMAAKTGLMSFQDALMIKQMADQIRSSGKNEEVPANNVMQEKLAMLSGRPAPQPQMPPQQQMPPPQMQQMQDPRMQAGLGAMPAPVMDNAQYADGGIVAFDEGGTPPKKKRSYYEEAVEYEYPTGIVGDPRNYNAGMGASHPEWASQNPYERTVGVDADGRPYPLRPPTEGVDLIPEGRVGGLGSFGVPRGTLKPINIDDEMAKDDYSAYDKWAQLMEIDPKEAAKQQAEDRRQALIMFGAKMAQASKDSDFYSAFGAGAEEYGKQTGESKKERRAAEKESKLARMNLEIGKGSEQRAGRRGLRDIAGRRDEAISADERQRMSIGVQMQGNAIAEASRQASINAARAGLPIEAAKAVGALTGQRIKAINDVRSSDPMYIELANVLKDEGPNSPEGQEALAGMKRIEQGATFDIDNQLQLLYTKGYAGFSVGSVRPQE
jgi:hypothetical protein